MAITRSAGPRAAWPSLPCRMWPRTPWTASSPPSGGEIPYEVKAKGNGWSRTSGHAIHPPGSRSMTDQIESRVLDIIAKSAGVEREKVTPETTFKDLGIGSLDAIEVIFDIEEAFDIHLPEQDAHLHTDNASR